MQHRQVELARQLPGLCQLQPIRPERLLLLLAPKLGTFSFLLLLTQLLLPAVLLPLPLLLYPTLLPTPLLFLKLLLPPSLLFDSLQLCLPLGQQRLLLSQLPVQPPPLLLKLPPLSCQRLLQLVVGSAGNRGLAALQVGRQHAAALRQLQIGGCGAAWV